MNYSTMTRITDLLEEFSQSSDNYSCWPVNEYKDGVVQASGRHEWQCKACCEKAAWLNDVKHTADCRLTRAKAAIAEALRGEQPDTTIPKQEP